MFSPRLRHALIGLACCALLFAAGAALGQDKSPNRQTQAPVPFIASGADMYKQYCAACHGVSGKGNGPAAYALKIPPADLSTLAKRHGGKFPYDYVTAVLRFGPGVTAHGSTDMPTWGPLFQVLDKQNERAVQQRVKNLSDYLVSLQEK
jgi:mono/diheme cytochrome c family protein